MNAAVCPYCRSAIELAEPATVLCPGCGTPHHADCLEENGGCTVFGCSAAPPAEPKLSIAAPDLSASPVVYAPPAPPAMPPPPPFIASSAAAPPPPMPAPYPEVQRAPLFSSLGYGPPQSIPYPSPTPSPMPAAFDPNRPARSRTAFLLLGVLLGAFGAHSFYAGSTKKGVLQLLITLLTLGLAGFMVWIWAVIDICTITTDSQGIPFRN
jgi:TM2 domain-containing membrane protein YozV